MIIEKKKLADLKPAPYNPRQATEEQSKQLTESLKKFGVVEPIVYNKQTGYIVGGHFRVRELEKLGYKEVDCVIVDLNEEEEKELNIRLNANSGDWDWDILANEWDEEQLQEWGLDVWQPEEEQEQEEKEHEPATHEMFSIALTIENKHKVLNLLERIQEEKDFLNDEQAFMHLIQSFMITAKA